jgi:hypothetical protein
MQAPSSQVILRIAYWPVPHMHIAYWPVRSHGMPLRSHWPGMPCSPPCTFSKSNRLYPAFSGRRHPPLAAPDSRRCAAVWAAKGFFGRRAWRSFRCFLQSEIGYPLAAGLASSRPHASRRASDLPSRHEPLPQSVCGPRPLGFVLLHQVYSSCVFHLGNRRVHLPRGQQQQCLPGTGKTPP